MFVDSTHLQCPGCYAAFDHFGGIGSSDALVCSFCGSALVEVPLTAFSEPVGAGLVVVGPPWREMQPQIPDRLFSPGRIPRLNRQEQADLVTICDQDFSRLVEGSSIHVEVEAFGNHESPMIGRWEASLLELDINHSDTGLNATLVGLASRVSDRVTQLLGQDSPDRQTHLKLLLKLWLEDQAGRLGTFLERSAVLVNWEYEVDAC